MPYMVPCYITPGTSLKANLFGHTMLINEVS